MTFVLPLFPTFMFPPASLMIISPAATSHIANEPSSAEYCRTPVATMASSYAILPNILGSPLILLVN